MSRLAPEDLAALGQHLSHSPAGAISIGALARRLGVSIPTARRRLQAYAVAHGLTLQSQPAREGSRGPASARWFLSSPAPASPRSPQVLPPEVRPVDALDEARDAALGLAPAILSALEDDERQALRLLARTGSARTSELAAQVGRSPDRMEGMMRMLRRKLHRLGSPMIDNDTLPDGEAMFRYVRNGVS